MVSSFHVRSGMFTLCLEEFRKASEAFKPEESNNNNQKSPAMLNINKNENSFHSWFQILYIIRWLSNR